MRYYNFALEIHGFSKESLDKISLAWICVLTHVLKW